jgi:outer membrane protein assembly factor BamE (lipoprotein component of BamABCDE complex)
MTNDEFPMTKEIRMTNDEKSKGLFRSISSFVLVLVVAAAVSCSGKRITKANVDQVTDGMSKKQVESILGPPTSRTTDVYVYRQGKDTVAIVFKDDKVQSKDSTLHD